MKCWQDQVRVIFVTITCRLEDEDEDQKLQAAATAHSLDTETHATRPLVVGASIGREPQSQIH